MIFVWILFGISVVCGFFYQELTGIPARWRARSLKSKPQPIELESRKTNQVLSRWYALPQETRDGLGISNLEQTLAELEEMFGADNLTYNTCYGEDSCQVHDFCILKDAVEETLRAHNEQQRLLRQAELAGARTEAKAIAELLSAEREAVVAGNDSIRKLL